MSKIISIVTPRKSTNISIDHNLWALFSLKYGKRSEDLIKEKAKQGVINSSSDAKLFILSQIVERELFDEAHSKKLLRKR